MMDDEDPTNRHVGYRNPPVATRFRKGQSGNPKGRPRGRSRRLPYEAVLGQEVIIRENGCERRVTAAEAFLLKLTKDGLEGDTAAARTMLDALAGLRGSDKEIPKSVSMVISFVDPGDLLALEPLRIGTTLDPYRDTARMVLEPWIVEAALACFGEKRLTAKEQEIVVKATRTPWKVRWPD
jgi:hypothetical protein